MSYCFLNLEFTINFTSLSKITDSAFDWPKSNLAVVKAAESSTTLPRCTDVSDSFWLHFGTASNRFALTVLITGINDVRILGMLPTLEILPMFFFTYRRVSRENAKKMLHFQGINLRFVRLIKIKNHVLVRIFQEIVAAVKKVNCVIQQAYRVFQPRNKRHRM